MKDIDIRGCCWCLQAEVLSPRPDDQTPPEQLALPPPPSAFNHATNTNSDTFRCYNAIQTTRLHHCSATIRVLCGASVNSVSHVLLFVIILLVQSQNFQTCYLVPHRLLSQHYITFLHSRASIATACIKYRNSVCLSWLSRPNTDWNPGEIETSGFHRMIA